MRRRLGGLAAAGVLLTIGIVGAMLAPVLIGWSGPAVPRKAYASTVALSPTPDPQPNAPAPPVESPTPQVSATPVQPKTTPSRQPYPYASLEEAAFALTNTERGRAGCPALKFNAKVRNAARNHSKDMAAKRYFSHTGKDKSDPGDRLQRAGYDASRGWAENIAYGYRTAEAVMTGWMGSDGHRKNILNCDLTTLGVGVAKSSDGTLYWTQDFGRT
jgi:uncharacterized protein YkwD